jgi:type IV secretory pathway TraG/TraD family ATPase VirD4
MSTKKPQNEDALTSMGVTIAQGIFFLFLAAFFLLLTLSVAMAKLEINLKEAGYSSGRILKKKAFFLAGVLPLALIIAMVVGYIKVDEKLYPDKLPEAKTEAEFREIVEQRQEEFKEAGWDLEGKRNELKYAFEEREQFRRDIRRVREIEEKSQIEEDFLANEQEISDIQTAIKSLVPVLNKKKELLSNARRDLKSFREGTYRRPVHIAARSMPASEQFWIYFYYIQMLLRYLALSLGASYVVMLLWPKKNKRFETFADISFGFWEAVSKAGAVPFRAIASFMGRESQEEKNIFNSKIMNLGIGPKAYLTDKNLNYHTQIIGGSGAGKTNLLKVMIEDRVRKGHGIIFFDFKADIELMDWMTGLSESSGRRDDLVMISMSDPKLSHTYNPLQYGTETEITSQIMNSLTWSESFYRDVAESGLMIIIKALCFRRDKGGKGFFLNDLYSFLTDASYRMDLLGEILSLSYPERFRTDLRRICEELSTNKKDNYQGLVNQISKIMNSTAGDIVSGTPGEAAEFNFKDSIRDGKISYLFMNSLKLKETASIMGKLMLQDLMKTVGNIYDDRHFEKRPVTLIIDEFASFATPDFGEFIEKARGAGIGVIVAYQSRQSLNSIEGDLALKLNENTATKVVFQVQDSDDAQWFCGLLGTQKVEKETHQAEEGLIFGDTKTGMKSVREVEEYVVHPNELKSLKTGEALLVCTKVDPHFCIMKINLAEEYSSEYVKMGNGQGTIIDQREVSQYPERQNNPEALQPQDLV